MKTFPPGWLVLVFLAAAIGLWFAMVFGSLATIAEWAGGLPPFDLRPLGYSHAEAVAFMEALGDGGRNFYVNLQLKLFDAAYPALYAISRVLAVLWLARAGRVTAGAFPGRLRLVLILVAVAAAGFDYAENYFLWDVLRAGSEVTPELVATASAMTVAKSVCSTVADAGLVVMLAMAIRRRLQARRVGA